MLSLLVSTTALVAKPNALRLRGGLADVDPTMVANGALALTGLNAAVIALSPAKAGEIYEVSLSGADEAIVKYMGLTLLGQAMMVYYSMQGESAATAIGYSILPQLIGNLQGNLNDEPGKLFGQTADEQLFGSRPKGAPAPKMRAPTPKVEDDVDSKWPLPRLELPDFGSVEKIGGERPADPTDSFDYGVGGIVKKAVYATAFAAVIWEVYINSPFFERAAPPPAVTAVQEEMSKYQPPVEGVEDPPSPPSEPAGE